MKDSKKIYYSLVKSEKSAVLNIFGDITSYAWEDFGEMSNTILSKKLEELGEVDVIDVYINSYGGEVAEGLAIYNALKRHKAKVRTHVDGFACSIASVIFMAGDERIMPNTSCLMIHNPWMATAGNAKDLRKQADDLEVIGECSISAYMEHINISEAELKELLDKESWLSPSEAVEMGFATSIEADDEGKNASQSIKGKVIKMMLDNLFSEEDNTDDENKDDDVSTTDNQDNEENNSNENDNQDNVDTEKDSETDSTTDEDNQEETDEDTKDEDNSTDDQETDSNNDDSSEDEEETEEKEDEEKEEDGKPSEKATKEIAAFFMSLEKEILK